MAKKEEKFEEFEQVFVLVEHPLKEEFDMPRGRKPGSKNKSAAKSNDVFVVTIGDGGAGKNRVTSDPVETALGLMAPDLGLDQLSARKMDKVFTLQTRMVPKPEADQYKLPDIMVLQPADGENNKSEEVRGKLTEVVGKLDKNRKFYGVGDEVFGFAMQLVEEKSAKSKRGRPRKSKDAAATPATTGGSAA